MPIHHQKGNIILCSPETKEIGYQENGVEEPF